MKILFMILLSVLVFTMTFASASDEFSTFDLYATGIIITLALSIQSLIGYIITYRILNNLILCSFTLINVISLNLIMNQEFMFQDDYLKYVELLVGMFIITTLMDMIDKHARAAKSLLALVAFAIVGILFQTTSSFTFRPHEQAVNSKSSAENIRLVNFKEKPNVYFISFDALIPQSISEKYLGMEPTAYHKVLDDHFRGFRNFFADFVATKHSLNSLLAFDREHFLKHLQSKSWYAFFSGRVPSPLFEVFKHNGYETNTLYDSFYFGKRGPFVDNHFVNDELEGICQFMDGGRRKNIAFFGYCRITNIGWISSFVDRYIIKKARTSSAMNKIEPVDFLIEKMGDSLKRGPPQIFVSYILSPGHAPEDYDTNDPEHRAEFVKEFKSNSEITAIELNKLVKFVAQNDPNAILFVFGDHGAFTSANVEFGDDKIFFVQDRFAIYGGIYPKNRCAKTFEKPHIESFMTILQAAHLIVGCLSGGVAASKKADDYRLPGAPFGIDESHSYESFRYE